jgi:hypothetical protein
VWPGEDWLVIAVDAGRASGHKVFVWNSGDFQEVETKE